MFETLYKLYHQKNTFHLFIISFIVFSILNIIENVIHYNIGKTSNKKFEIFKPDTNRLEKNNNYNDYFCLVTRISNHVFLLDFTKCFYFFLFSIFLFFYFSIFLFYIFPCHF